MLMHKHQAAFNSNNFCLFIFSALAKNLLTSVHKKLSLMWAIFDFDWGLPCPPPQTKCCICVSPWAQKLYQMKWIEQERYNTNTQQEWEWEFVYANKTERNEKKKKKTRLRKREESWNYFDKKCIQWLNRIDKRFSIVMPKQKATFMIDWIFFRSCSLSLSPPSPLYFLR